MHVKIEKHPRYFASDGYYNVALDAPLGLQCCRDCGMPCEAAKDAEAFHDDQDENENEEASE
jgi:hypothetical protein